MFPSIAYNTPQSQTFFKMTRLLERLTIELMDCHRLVQGASSQAFIERHSEKIISTGTTLFQELTDYVESVERYIDYHIVILSSRMSNPEGLSELVWKMKLGLDILEGNQIYAQLPKVRDMLENTQVVLSCYGTQVELPEYRYTKNPFEEFERRISKENAA